jgi:hypothetical protein
MDNTGEPIPIEAFLATTSTSCNLTWNIFAGTWNVSNGELIQSDETATNSNIYAALNQTLSNRYLYHFKAKVSGSGTNKRYGFHFFCDDVIIPTDINSYFVWFRVEDQQLQFYKVVNDTFSLKNTILQHNNQC